MKKKLPREHFLVGGGFIEKCNKNLFYSLLYKENSSEPDWIDVLLNNKNKSLLRDFLEYSGVDKGFNEFRNFYADHIEILCDTSLTEEYEKLLLHYDIKFNLGKSKSECNVLQNPMLLKFLIENNLYAITKENIDIMIAFVEERSDPANIGNYYEKLSGDIFKDLASYVFDSENIDEFVANVMLAPETVMDERSPWFEELISNTSIDKSLREQIISNNRESLKKLKDVTDSAMYDVLFRKKKIDVSFENIYTYYKNSRYVITDSLRDFLSMADNTDVFFEERKNISTASRKYAHLADFDQELSKNNIKYRKLLDKMKKLS